MGPIDPIKPDPGVNSHISGGEGLFIDKNSEI